MWGGGRIFVINGRTLRIGSSMNSIMAFQNLPMDSVHNVYQMDVLN